MCGISGIFNLNNKKIINLESKLKVMVDLQTHRGPDGSGIWINDSGSVGLGHNRLSIIDLKTGNQPMTNGVNTIVYNGEIYNYKVIRESNEKLIQYQTNSDTEVILNSITLNGISALNDFKGMFAFGIYNDYERELLLVRDRVGIKPLYYLIQDELIYFASEVKALLPFVSKIETDSDGLSDYLDFQFLFGHKTMFKSINQLEPGHFLKISSGKVEITKYWDVNYDIDFDTSELEFHRQIREKFLTSIEEHLVSDVKLGSYLSGGLDSSIVTSVASLKAKDSLTCFIGKYTDHSGYDESLFARKVTELNDNELIEVEIKSEDFVKYIQKVIYHLDYPVAGPGSFGQFMVAQEASKHRKTILGGQGGDEIFGGYARYMIAYIEQALLGEIDGTSTKGNYVLTLEKSLRNLVGLKSYKPLIKSFWSKGLFDPSDSRYLQLVKRGDSVRKLIKDLKSDSEYSSNDEFYHLFNSNNFVKESYFDKMTHFDFKTLLPALLHVEDRMSMANGIESRVPFLDHELIELVAKIPANYKFKDGKLKEILKQSLGDFLPHEILNRKDKMGFPIPLTKWFKSDLRNFIIGIFDSKQSRDRNFFENDKILECIDSQDEFSRDLWALLSLELWFREFHDKQDYYKDLINNF